MFDLAAYLARVDLPARPTGDAEGLRRLQRQHRLAIPFENIDVRLGRGIAIDGAAVFAKLVEARRGGYCFEHDRLFADALLALGFDVRPLLARVWLGATEPPPPTHTLSLVRVDGQAWIADAGFGGSYAPPMPLVDGAEASASDGARFRLERQDAAWMLWRDGPAMTTDGRGAGEGWLRQYDFAIDPVTPAELAEANARASTLPGSRFVAHTVASIVLPHGLAALTDRRYRRSAGGKVVEAVIDDPRVYRLRLSLMFGIDLSKVDAERLFAEAG